MFPRYVGKIDWNHLYNLKTAPYPILEARSTKILQAKQLTWSKTPRYLHRGVVINNMVGDYYINDQICLGESYYIITNHYPTLGTFTIYQPGYQVDFVNVGWNPAQDGHQIIDIYIVFKKIWRFNLPSLVMKSWIAKIWHQLILLMAEILHQLIGSLSHDLQGLYIPGGAGFLPSTVDFDRFWQETLHSLPGFFGSPSAVRPQSSTQNKS